jgi:hypothetical protein
MAIRNGTWRTVLICLTTRFFSTTYSLTHNSATTRIANCIQFATNLVHTQASPQYLPVNIHDVKILLPRRRPSSCPCPYRAWLPRHTFQMSICGHAPPLKWPPGSPNLNPCDFWPWLLGMVKANVYVTKPHDVDTENKDQRCHPKNSSACVCTGHSHVHVVPNMPWRERRTCWNYSVFSRRYMQKICTKYIISSLPYECHQIQGSSCIWTKTCSVKWHSWLVLLQAIWIGNRGKEIWHYKKAFSSLCSPELNKVPTASSTVLPLRCEVYSSCVSPQIQSWTQLTCDY